MPFFFLSLLQQSFNVLSCTGSHLPLNSNQQYKHFTAKKMRFQLSSKQQFVRQHCESPKLLPVGTTASNSGLDNLLLSMGQAELMFYFYRVLVQKTLKVFKIVYNSVAKGKYQGLRTRECQEILLLIGNLVKRFFRKGNINRKEGVNFSCDAFYTKRDNLWRHWQG